MVPLNVPVWFAIASILGPLGERLHRWTQVGQLGHLFDSRGRIRSGSDGRRGAA